MRWSNMLQISGIYMTKEKLADAITLLQEAQDEAGLGTSMMIEQEVEHVREIKSRLIDIHNDNANDNNE